MVDLELVKRRLEQNKEFLNNGGRFSPERWKVEARVNDQFVEDFIEDGREWLDAAFTEIERLRGELAKYHTCKDIFEDSLGFTCACEGTEAYLYHKDGE